MFIFIDVVYDCLSGLFLGDVRLGENLLSGDSLNERLGDIFLISGLWDDLIILSVLSGVFA